VSEPSGARLLQGVVLNDDVNMTVELCLKTCASSDTATGQPYRYAGVEYGRECWCGDTLDLAGATQGTTPATPSKNLTASACGFACPGNATESCGGSLTMNLFYFDAEKAANQGGD